MHLANRQTVAEVHKTTTFSFTALAIESIREKHWQAKTRSAIFFLSAEEVNKRRTSWKLNVVQSLIQPTPPFSSLHPPPPIEKQKAEVSQKSKQLQSKASKNERSSFQLSCGASSVKWKGHRKGSNYHKVTFRKLALGQSEWRRANARNNSFIFLRL